MIDNRQGGFLAFSKVADQIKKDTKDISSFTKKSSQLLTQQVTNKGFTGTFGGDTGVQFGVPGGKIGPALPRGFRLRQQFAPGGAFLIAEEQQVEFQVDYKVVLLVEVSLCYLVKEVLEPLQVVLAVL